MELVYEEVYFTFSYLFFLGEITLELLRYLGKEEKTLLVELLSS